MQAFLLQPKISHFKSFTIQQLKMFQTDEQKTAIAKQGATKMEFISFQWNPRKLGCRQSAFEASLWSRKSDSPSVFL